MNIRTPEPGEGMPRVKEEAEAVGHSHLVDEWNRVVEDIRKVDGFPRFMLPPLYFLTFRMLLVTVLSSFSLEGSCRATQSSFYISG